MCAGGSDTEGWRRHGRLRSRDMETADCSLGWSPPAHTRPQFIFWYNNTASLHARSWLLFAQGRRAFDLNRISLKEKYHIYERMLQLGHNGAAVELLLDITERIATERNRSANRGRGV